MSIAERFLGESEQLAERVKRKVPLRVFPFINYG
jgi:hypothetical protein